MDRISELERRLDETETVLARVVGFLIGAGAGIAIITLLALLA